MAKSVKEQVDADVAAARIKRLLADLEADYERYIAMAAEPQQTERDVEHYKSLAADRLGKIRKIKEKKGMKE